MLKTDETALLRAWRPYVKAAIGDVTTLLKAPGGRYREDDVSRLDARVVGRTRQVKENDLKAAGMERAVEGVWYQGPEDSPTRIVTTLAIVSRDEAGARKVASLVEATYRKFDSGTPIPNGRLYLVGITFGDKEYVDGVAIISVGLVTYEIAVSYELYSGDPRGEARSLAVAQHRVATTA